MLEVLTADYIETARAKGLTPATIVIKHALRNAVLPVITLLGALVANVLTGSFVIEKILPFQGWGNISSMALIIVITRSLWARPYFIARCSLL